MVFFIRQSQVKSEVLSSQKKKFQRSNLSYQDQKKLFRERVSYNVETTVFEGSLAVSFLIYVSI